MSKDSRIMSNYMITQIVVAETSELGVLTILFPIDDND